MPKLRQSPVVLSLREQIHSWRQRAQTLRMIAASSHDVTARKVLSQRADVWEKRAMDAEKDAPAA